MRLRLGMAAALTALCLAGVAVAQPAAPDAPDPARLQLAQQVVSAQGGVDTYKAQLNGMFSTIATMVKGSMPAGQSDLIDTMFKYMADEEIAAAPQMMNDVAEVYAEHLTEQELRDMLAWTTSDRGRSIRQKMPAITQELLQRQAPLMRKLMAGVMQKAVERACAERHCTPAQHDAMNAAIAKIMPPPS